MTERCARVEEYVRKGTEESERVINHVIHSPVTCPDPTTRRVTLSASTFIAFLMNLNDSVVGLVFHCRYKIISLIASGGFGVFTHSLRGTFALDVISQVLSSARSTRRPGQRWRSKYNLKDVVRNCIAR
jgi:hypothetical protein